MSKVLMTEIVEPLAGLENMASSLAFLAAASTDDWHVEAIRVTLNQCILATQVAVARRKTHHAGKFFP